ncbi:MAG: succinylglutamate desuccinylase/aspartoacylase family protein [Planctomycetes bacterium]|nr:succinylglutamate desuccinylase/aspartoacylase family protein [Planctomycetota bacterium]
MTRITIGPKELDFDSIGRRDYFVRVEHPTTWGHYLVPITVIVGPQAKAGKGMVAFGSTHGNEYEGIVAIKNVMRRMKTEDVLGRVILVPVLNPSAFRSGTRDSQEDNGNLNRVFPGEEHGTLTQRFAYLVTEFIFPQVHVVLDLHSGGNLASFPGVSSFHHVSDDAQFKEMQTVAQGFGCPFTMMYQDETPGLLTSTAERLGKITIGTELGWGESVILDGVKMGERGILFAAMYSKQLKESPLAEKVCSDQKLTDGSGVEASVLAEVSGLFEPNVLLGDLVRKGDVLGFIHNFETIDEDPTEIIATMDGYIICLAWNAKVTKGYTVALIGADIAWTNG